ncbi:MAG: class I SAM-dependent methyltransferase [Rhizomicrobium sp.]|jgi:methyltransferase (TIGR00027 family)
MFEDKASATALGAALHRATHQLLDRPAIFPDPLALRIIGREAEKTLREGKCRHILPGAVGLRAFLVVRSRFTEDCLAEAMARGVGQYVLLGAGLDTFAYRGAYDPARLRIFEVDHPATQEWKRGRLREAEITAPASVFYAPVDFERETIAEGLARAGFDFTAPAFFAWLGVVPYLTREAVMDTLRFVAERTGASSEIVFDYPETADTMSPVQRRAMQMLAARTDAVGEPFRTAFKPDEIKNALLALGFNRIVDMDATALNARYCSGRDDAFALRGNAHIMRAGTRMGEAS